ncbi:MAG: alpha/beta fold hydrolase [Clostridia bacterium]|nr:alpha/beta fold hydrolase [Clostridia bacterium]MBR4458514.1 alpha/beta fold hydrolase [Clostridia bacterium]
MTDQAFTCVRDGLRIVGHAFYPECAGRSPAVIISHGFTGNLADCEPVARMFCADGYAAFTFSFCGGSQDSTPPEKKSDGESTAMSLRSEVRDLLTVLDWVRTRPEVDPERISLLGFSQGGCVSGLAAGAAPDKVEQLIMVFPALCIPDHARRGCLGGAAYDPADPPEILDCGRTRLGRAFHEEASATDIYLELERYRGPVLILHGTEDQVVDCTYSVRAQAAYRKGQCRLQIVRGMGHSTEGMLDSLYASMRAFLSGKRELFNVQVVITSVEDEHEGDTLIRRIPFTGWCDSSVFRGAILPGACDTQRYPASGEGTCVADYTLSGLDADRKACTIHIVNRMIGGEWKPAVRTDSECLSWINDADFTAVLEHSATGPTVRFWTDPQSEK